MENNETMDAQISELATDIKYIQRDITEIKEALKLQQVQYVLKSEFNQYRQEVAEKFAPLTKIVYGAISVILIEVLTAILYLVIKK